MTMTIQEAIEKINSKQATREIIAGEMGISPNTLTRRISKAGFAYDNSKKEYVLSSPNLASPNQEIKKVKKRENKKTNKEEIKQDGEQSIQETKKTIKKVTYEIDEELHFELRMEAFRQKKNVSVLVEQAIRNLLKK